MLLSIASGFVKEWKVTCAPYFHLKCMMDFIIHYRISGLAHYDQLCKCTFICMTAVENMGERL